MGGNKSFNDKTYISKFGAVNRDRLFTGLREVKAYISIKSVSKEEDLPVLPTRIVQFAEI